MDMHMDGVTFWQFFRMGWNGRDPQESLTGIEKMFLSWVPMNMQKDWKAKLESAYYFMLKYSEITV